MKFDLQMTENGELIVGPDGDLAYTWGDEQVAQEVLFRLKTTKADWVLSPSVGCSLEDFIGQPNTSLTRSLIESRVLQELTRDSLLFGPSVDCVPISPEEVLIVVEFNSVEDEKRIIQINAGLDMRKGLVFSRVGIRQA